MKPDSRPPWPRLILAGVLVAQLGCDEGQKPEASAPASSAETGSPARSEPPAESGRVTGFGVAECDSYVAKYVACVEANVTGEEKEKLLAGFEANRTQWRALATMREGAAALGLACRAAAQKAKEELSARYGCPF